MGSESTGWMMCHRAACVRVRGGQKRGVRGTAGISNAVGRQTGSEDLEGPMRPARELGLSPAGARPNVGNEEMAAQTLQALWHLVWWSDLNMFPVGSMDCLFILFCFDVDVVGKVNLETLK